MTGCRASSPFLPFLKRGSRRLGRNTFGPWLLWSFPPLPAMWGQWSVCPEDLGDMVPAPSPQALATTQWTSGFLCSLCPIHLGEVARCVTGLFSHFSFSPILCCVMKHNGDSSQSDFGSVLVQTGILFRFALLWSLSSQAVLADNESATVLWM